MNGVKNIRKLVQSYLSDRTRPERYRRDIKLPEDVLGEENAHLGGTQMVLNAKCRPVQEGNIPILSSVVKPMLKIWLKTDVYVI